MKVTSFTGVAAAIALAVGAQATLAAPSIDSHPAAAVVSAAAPNAAVQFRVFLPLRNPQALDDLIAQLHDPKSAQYQHWLEPAEFVQRFGPTAADLATLKQSLVSHGFTIISEDAHGVRVEGPASVVAKSFAVSVNASIQNGHTRFMAKGTMQLPSELAALDARVVGLEGIPEHRVHSRSMGPIADIPSNRYDIEGPYWFDDLKQAYDYPAFSKKTDGAGVSAAVLMEDLLYPGDVAAAFNHEKFTAISGVKVPSVTTVKVDGGGAVGGPGTFEASLDVQQILGGAPGTDVTLVSLPDLSDAHILDGYAYIIDKNTFDLVNSSFGECELEYTAPFNQGTDFTYILKEYHELFQQGAAQGITFSASSGDEGALLCPGPDYGYPGATNVTFQLGVSTPADDPNVTAVGGGNLSTTYKSGSLNSAYVAESDFADPEIPNDPYGVGQNVYGGVWGAGGGISQIYGKPKYQTLAKTGSATQRTLPDVGMQVGGCPEGLAESCRSLDSAAVVAYGVNYGGGFYGVIGTSVSSPEFVGALALWEQQFGAGKQHRKGNVNYFLYLMGAVQTAEGGIEAPAEYHYFHRHIPGFDGYYEGGYPSSNYDYIYGQGSPDVRALFGLKEYPAAGVPQTSSNP
jgi:subtilase family serine protease